MGSSKDSWKNKHLMAGMKQSLFPMMKNKEEYNTVGNLCFVDEKQRRTEKKNSKEPALVMGM